MLIYSIIFFSLAIFFLIFKPVISFLPAPSRCCHGRHPPAPATCPLQPAAEAGFTRAQAPAARPARGLPKGSPEPPSRGTAGPAQAPLPARQPRDGEGRSPPPSSEPPPLKPARPHRPPPQPCPAARTPRPPRRLRTARGGAEAPPFPPAARSAAHARQEKGGAPTAHRGRAWRQRACAGCGAEV